MIDTNKIQTGQIIKNYNRLCEILGQPTKGGKGKTYQLREFERYFRYHNDGHKFVIDEIYDKPLPKIDNRKNNGGHIANTKYEDLMDRLIINLLVDIKSIDFSFSEFFKFYVPIFSDEYTNLSKVGYKKFAKNRKMSKGLVLLYLQKVRKITMKCLETSLDRLQRENIIKWKKNIVIKNQLYREEFADEETKLLINEHESIAYAELGITHFHRINPKINKEFKRKVCNKLDGIISYWNVYSVEVVDTGIEEVEEDLDELIIRFIYSLHKAIKDKKSIDEFGNVFYPYSSSKYENQIYKLDKMLWELPEKYISDHNLDTLFAGEEDISKDKELNIDLQEIVNMPKYQYEDHPNIPF